MMRTMPLLGACALALAAVPLWHVGASSQAGRTVRVIVPFPLGGTADALARILGEEITHATGTAMVIENRPGGALNGTEAAARAAPDGNTVLVVTNSFVIDPSIRKTSYDPLTSFAPICNLLRLPQLVVVNAASPYRTLADLLDAARARPGELALAGIGPRTRQRIAFELFKQAAGVDMTRVGFAGTAPALDALLGGRVTAVLANYSELLEQVNAGRLRPLATTSRMRIPRMPDVPTLAEAGFKGFQLEVWFGLLAPAGTPPERLADLGLWFLTAMHTAPVEAKLATLGLHPVGLCGDVFADFLRQEREEYARVIHAADIKGE